MLLAWCLGRAMTQMSMAPTRPCSQPCVVMVTFKFPTAYLALLKRTMNNAQANAT